ncbi:MAG: trypsin-like peptidase domain-containing protein [Phycisphaerales bacterium]
MMTMARSVVVGLLAAWLLASPAWSQKADAGVQEDLRHARALSRTFGRAVKTVAPSVVHITQTRRVAFRRGWFEPVETEMRPTGAGSGVVVSTDGYIVTNNHVIENAEGVQVKFADGRVLEGKIIGRDPATDLGVVRVDAEGLKAASWGDSESLEVGDWVMAVGSPFGQFDNTVTAGIVSAKNRTGLASTSDERFEDFIQTDAAINPGNSGGPLVDLEGKVVGINSQIATRTGGSVGIGFSIPSSIAKAVTESIIKSGRAQRGWLGVRFGGMAAASADGVAVAEIVRGSPADKAGLELGDVVVRYNGRVVGNETRLRNAIAFTPPGTEATMDLVRDGGAKSIRVRVLDREDAFAQSAGGAAYRKFGFIASTLTPQMIAQLGYRGEIEGVIVSRLDPLGPAATGASPLQHRDIVVQVNRTPTPDVETFDRVVKEFNGSRLRLGVIRGPQQGYIELTARP